MSEAFFDIIFYLPWQHKGFKHGNGQKSTTIKSNFSNWLNLSHAQIIYCCERSRNHIGERNVKWQIMIQVSASFMKLWCHKTKLKVGNPYDTLSRWGSIDRIRSILSTVYILVMLHLNSNGCKPVQLQSLE